jgi:hypothetical protein
VTPQVETPFLKILEAVKKYSSFKEAYSKWTKQAKSIDLKKNQNGD